MKYTLHNEQIKQNCIKEIHAIDVSVSPVMEVEILPYRKTRTKEQNALMWSGMLNDFAEQVFIDGMQFSKNIWHEHLKEKFLPEHYDKELTRKNYVKWVQMPSGKYKLEGSTTQLTTKGMSTYLTQCESYGANELEIRFSVSPKQGY